MGFERTYNSYRYSEYFKTDIPEHWEEKRLGWLAKGDKAAFVDGPFGSDLKTDDYIDEGVPLIQLNNIRDSKHIFQNMKFVSDEKKNELIRHIAIPGDVVIAKMADPVARAAVVSDKYEEYVIVADCVKLSPNTDVVDLNYLVWAINCDVVRINAELVSTGTTRVRINLGELKKLKIPYPPFDEQKAIFNFLDHETAKIDTLIEKQQQLIKLLKEKRQAVISHAVTKGLNPDAPMRDSGVEWLGEVPAHWLITPLKYVSTIRYGIGEPPQYMSEGVPLVRATNIRSGRISNENLALVNPDDIPANRIVWLEGGDIIVVRSGAGTGDSSIIPEEYAGSIAGFDMVVKATKCKAEFLGHALLSNYVRSNQIDLEKTRAAQPHLNAEELGACFILLPPDDEQMEIAQYIDRAHLKLDVLMLQAEKAEILLRERRTALISAAVTGKIDVRGWQAPDQENKEDAA